MLSCEDALRPGWLPGLCAICRAWQRRVICTDCLHREFRAERRCPRCAARLPPGAAHCVACSQAAFALSSTVAACSYESPWDGLVAQMKFHDRAPLVGPLAQLLAFRIRQAGTHRPHALVPLPTTRARRIERGAELTTLLARALGHELRLPVWTTVLERHRESPPQRSLDRAQRQRNLRGAFAVPPVSASRLGRTRIALVDDVMTTGATLDEAARTLQAAGVHEVQAWVLARTERRDGATTPP